MQFRVLGALEVLADGQPLSLGGPKQRTVLATLLLHPNQVVAAEDLIDQVWGEEPPDTARKTLQGYGSVILSLVRPVGVDQEERFPPLPCSKVPAEHDAAVLPGVACTVAVAAKIEALIQCPPP